MLSGRRQRKQSTRGMIYRKCPKEANPQAASRPGLSRGWIETGNDW